MSYGLLLLSVALTCVSARFTVPVPIHYEIEAQFQKQSGTKMRWDPTNYLTYLAAVYSQCSHLYQGNALSTRGRVPNNTAYNNLVTFFDPSLLPNNLVVFAWDVASDASQDAGTVDRDLRKLFASRTGAALANIPSLDSNLRNYDRFGCSVETACKTQSSSGQSQSVMTFVCVFGTTVAPRQVSGTGNQPQPQPQPQPQTTRPTVATRPTTTRPRGGRPTPTQRPTSSGFYESFTDASAEFYEFVVNEFSTPEGVTNFQSADVVAQEQKVTAIGLCKYENNPTAFTAELLQSSFDSDVQAIYYSVTPDTMPTAQDMTTTPITAAARNAISAALGSPQSPPISPATSLACSWAVCTQKVVVGCAAWGVPSYD